MKVGGAYLTVQWALYNHEFPRCRHYPRPSCSLSFLYMLSRCSLPCPQGVGLDLSSVVQVSSDRIQLEQPFDKIPGSYFTDKEKYAMSKSIQNSVHLYPGVIRRNLENGRWRGDAQ